MAAPRRTFACIVTLTAMLSPFAAVSWTVFHLALDTHHADAAAVTEDARRDAASVLHGHRHGAGTPDHDHEATAAATSPALPLPGPTLHPSVADCAPASLATELGLRLSGAPSPPQPVPIILRI